MTLQIIFFSKLNWIYNLIKFKIRFCINVIKSATSHCLLHFDHRFDQGVTVRNVNWPNGSWQHEERSTLTLQRARSFFMEIKCMQDRFQVLKRSAIKFSTNWYVIYLLDLYWRAPSLRFCAPLSNAGGRCAQNRRRCHDSIGSIQIKIQGNLNWIK